jgi:hypothetical protein
VERALINDSRTKTVPVGLEGVVMKTMGCSARDVKITTYLNQMMKSGNCGGFSFCPVCVLLVWCLDIVEALTLL